MGDTDDSAIQMASGKRFFVRSVAAVAFIGLILGPATASGGDSSRTTVLPLAGDLDPSFGNSGEVVSGEVVSDGAHQALAIQSDGKIVVAGATVSGELLLSRYLTNGSPDPTFGDGGNVATPIGVQAAGGGDALGVALQPDGRIVVVGVSYQGDKTYPGSEGIESEFVLARFNPNGSLDTSFGTDGITNTVIPEDRNTFWSAGAGAVAILPDGAILVGGTARWEDGGGEGQSSFALARYTPSGSLDPTFGEGGIEQTPFVGADADLASLELQPDGKIVATGSAVNDTHGGDIFTMALARYKPDGSLDPTFGTDGEVETAAKLHFVGGPSALRDGKIVVAGFRSDNRDDALFPVVARFRGRGRVDPTFGKHGYEEIRWLRGFAAHAVATQPDGKILIATYFGVIRLTQKGRLDPSFGRQAVAATPYDGVGAAELAVQPDGNILFGGTVPAPPDYMGNPVSTLARVIGGNNCVVPDLRGKTVSKARAKLQKSYCDTGRISKTFSNRVARGRVITTTPLRRDRLPDHTKVSLLVSRGKLTQRS